MQNKYDEYYDFRMADVNDVPRIMEFIGKHLQEDHILACDEEFFRYYYGEPGRDDRVNFFLMLEKNGEIAGINGYSVYGRIDGCLYFSGSLTIVREDLKIPMSGLEMMKRQPYFNGDYRETNSGTNPRTMLPLFQKIFKYDVGLMEIYYLPNYGEKEFRLIKIPGTDCRKAGIQKPDARFVPIRDIRETDFDFGKKYEKLVYKPKEFIDYHYLKHPVFRYLLYEISVGEDVKGIVILRKAEHDGAAILFLVDYLGDIEALAYTNAEFQRLLGEQRAECIHFMEAGVPAAILDQAGFIRVDIESEETVIPTHFEPYEQTNIKNYYARNDKDMIVFKGHGDQDNPRMKRKGGSK